MFPFPLLKPLCYGPAAALESHESRKKCRAKRATGLKHCLDKIAGRAFLKQVCTACHLMFLDWFWLGILVLLRAEVAALSPAQSRVAGGGG